MIRRALLVACVIALPSLATAQRGGGSGATKKTEFFDKNEKKGPTLRVRDVEDISSIHLLLDKKKELKLSDAQVNTLKELENKAKDKNGPQLKIVDSLIHELMVTRSNNSDDEKSRVRSTQADLVNAIAAARGTYDAAAKEGMATFDADQQAKANDLMAKQRSEGDKMLREKMMGGGGGGGGGF
ncbi:MAG: Spy/CpxP family protein refolding chaperone [Gemmatimonadaceae bacterium]